MTMNTWDLLTSAEIQGFLEEAFLRKWDALQVSTKLNKAGYGNEDRAAIMDYMALVPKFRDKFFGDTERRENSCSATGSHWNRAPRKISDDGNRTFGQTKAP